MFYSCYYHTIFYISILVILIYSLLDTCTMFRVYSTQATQLQVTCHLSRYLPNSDIYTTNRLYHSVSYHNRHILLSHLQLILYH